MTGPTERWLGAGFGLALRSAYPVTGLRPWDEGPPADETSLLLDDDGPRIVPPPGGQLLRDARYADGRPGMVIEGHGGSGFRIFAEEFGEHRIAVDGSTVNSRPATGLSAWRWQRLLIGQVLPLVSALRGLEVLHASAVVRGGQAFALVGESGAGKSTLAAHLALRGNELLAEDVLALSLTPDGYPIAHPGSTAMSLRPDQAAIAAQLTRLGIAEEIGTDEKEHILLRAPGESLPLAAVYHLRPDPCSHRPIGPSQSPSITELMSYSYVNYLQTSARRAAQFEVQAAIARRIPMVPVNVSEDLAPDRLAAELEANMVGLAAEGIR